MIFLNPFGIASIFMLHRVDSLEKGKLSPNEQMKIPPERLATFIEASISKGYDFIDLDELYHILVNRLPARKKMIITMDDGYKDNFTNAYPVFKKFRVPFTIYVTTSFPEKNAMLWWYTLEDILAENDTFFLEDGTRYSCGTMSEKIDTYLKVREKILSLPAKNFNEQVRNLFFRYQPDWRKKTEELAMSWKQIVEMSKDPIATIGAHTLSHHSLKKHSKERAFSEIMESKTLIETKIGKPVDHFAYPFGGTAEAGQREYDIVRECGFKTGVTTVFGNIFHDHADSLEALPRIMLREPFRRRHYFPRTMKSFARVLKSRITKRTKGNMKSRCRN